MFSRILFPLLFFIFLFFVCVPPLRLVSHSVSLFLPFSPSFSNTLPLFSCCYLFCPLLFYQTYGYPYLFTLNNLEAVGLLKKREKVWGVGAVDTGSPWPALRRSLRLVKDAVDVRSPDDIAYVSSGRVFLFTLSFRCAYGKGPATFHSVLLLLFLLLSSSVDMAVLLSVLMMM